MRVGAELLVLVTERDLRWPTTPWCGTTIVGGLWTLMRVARLFLVSPSWKPTPSLAFALALLASGGTYADAAGACTTVSHASERRELQQLLSSNGVSDGEQAFLLAGAEQRLKEVRSNSLNARGAQCGIESVRAHILSCMNNTLPTALRSTPPDKKSSAALWGRAGLSVRGGVFIGVFHACRGGAMETFLSK